MTTPWDSHGIIGWLPPRADVPDVTHRIGPDGGGVWGSREPESGFPVTLHTPWGGLDYSGPPEPTIQGNAKQRWHLSSEPVVGVVLAMRDRWKCGENGPVVEAGWNVKPETGWRRLVHLVVAPTEGAWMERAPVMVLSAFGMRGSALADAFHKHAASVVRAARSKGKQDAAVGHYRFKIDPNAGSVKYKSRGREQEQAVPGLEPVGMLRGRDGILSWMTDPSTRAVLRRWAAGGPMTDAATAGYWSGSDAA